MNHLGKTYKRQKTLQLVIRKRKSDVHGSAANIGNGVQIRLYVVQLETCGGLKRR